MECFAQCLRHKPLGNGSDSLLFFQMWVWVCPSHLGEWGQADAQSPSAYQTQSPFPSEGSVIAYYWSEFNIPNYLVEEAERAMAEEHAVKLPPRTRTLHSFTLTSVVAFRECRVPGWAFGGPGCGGAGEATAPGRVPGSEDCAGRHLPLGE